MYNTLYSSLYCTTYYTPPRIVQHIILVIILYNTLYSLYTHGLVSSQSHCPTVLGTVHYAVLSIIPYIHGLVSSQSHCPHCARCSTLYDVQYYPFCFFFLFCFVDFLFYLVPHVHTFHYQHHIVFSLRLPSFYIHLVTLSQLDMRVTP